MKKIAVSILFTLCVILMPQSVFAAGNLTVFIWSEYMDPEIITEFEKTYDVKVRMDYYESNEEMVAKLQSGGLGQYDIILPSTYILPSLKNLRLIEKLDHSKIFNIKNISNEFTNMEVDPGNQYSIPYLWGTSGMVVRHADAGSIPHSWKIVFDPKYNQGNFVIFDTARDAIGSALKYLGYSMNSTDPQEIEQAAKLLLETKKYQNFLGFDGGVGGLNKVMGGVATVAQVYSGEAIKAYEEDEEVHYIIPEEGCELWTDLIAIPLKAPNIDNAYKFLNFILDAEVGARLATYNRYATPNEAAKAFIPPEDLNNPAMYPKHEQMQKMEYFKDLGSYNRIYDEAWTMIKTN